MGAVQIHLTYSVGSGDAYLGQPAVPVDDLGGAWNFKPTIRLCSCSFDVWPPEVKGCFLRPDSCVKPGSDCFRRRRSKLRHPRSSSASRESAI